MRWGGIEPATYGCACTNRGASHYATCCLVLGNVSQQIRGVKSPHREVAGKSRGGGAAARTARLTGLRWRSSSGRTSRRHGVVRGGRWCPWRRRRVRATARASRSLRGRRRASSDIGHAARNGKGRCHGGAQGCMEEDGGGGRCWGVLHRPETASNGGGGGELRRAIHAAWGRDGRRGVGESEEGVTGDL